MTTVTLPLGARYGVMSVTETIDYHTGTVRYTVNAPRVTGVFVVRPPDYGDEPIPTSLGVWYGDGPPHSPEGDRTGRPVVNGVRICGGTVFASPGAWQQITWRAVNVHVPTGPYTSRPAPDKTAQRTAAVVRALLGRFWNHPGRRAIIRAAARHDAAHRLAETRRAIARLRDQADTINNELAERTRRACLLSRLAAEHARRQPGQDQPAGAAGPQGAG